MQEYFTQRHQGNILKSIRFLLLASLFTPLVITRSTLFPFIFGKAILFQIFVEIALALYAMLLVIDFQQFRPRLNLLGKFVIGFGAALLVASIFGIDPYTSMWGRVERMDGFVSLVHYLIFFVLLTASFRSHDSWKFALRTNAIAAFIVQLYAFGQKIGFGAITSASVAGRIDGTLGNATFLAAYTMISMLLLVILYYWDEIRSWRMFYGISFVLANVVVLLTASRGAMIGVGIAYASLMLTWFFSTKQKQTKIRLGAIIAIGIVVVSGAFIYKDSDFVQSIPALRRVTNIDLRELDESSRARISGWKLAVDGFLERPLLGYGLDSYLYLSSTTQSREHSQISEEWFDKSHNHPIEYLVSAGLPGFIGYVGLFVSSWYLLWRIRKKMPFESKVLSILLLGYLFQISFLFDTPATFLAFYFLLAFVSSLSRTDEAEKPSKLLPNFSGIRNQQVLLSFPVVLGLILSVALYQINIRPVQASQTTIDAMREFQLQFEQSALQDQSASLFEEALNYDTYISGEIIKNGLAPLARRGFDGTNIEQYLPLIELGLPAAEEFLQEHPTDVKIYINLGFLYNIAGRIEPEYLKRAEEMFERYIALVPERGEGYLEYSMTKMIQGDIAAAVALVDKALEIRPKEFFQQWRRAQLLLNIPERKEEGLDEIVQYVLTHGNWQGIHQLAFAGEEEYQQLIERLQPHADENNPVALAAQGNLWIMQRRDEAKARDALARAVELRPEFSAVASSLIAILENEKVEK